VRKLSSDIGSGKLMFAMVLFLAAAVAGCGSAGGELPMAESDRMVFSHFQGAGTYDLSEGVYTADAPFTLTCMPSATPSTTEDLGHTRWMQHVLRCEIDFGDGSGWLDVTARKMAWDALDASTWEQHTYAVPGEYEPDVRVTYWDGEVLYQNSDFAVHVTVTAPAE
jgi:hypothetical protein